MRSINMIVIFTEMWVNVHRDAWCVYEWYTCIYHKQCVKFIFHSAYVLLCNEVVEYSLGLYDLIRIMALLMVILLSWLLRDELITIWWRLLITICIGSSICWCRVLLLLIFASVNARDICGNDDKIEHERNIFPGLFYLMFFALHTTYGNMFPLANVISLQKMCGQRPMA